MNVNTRWVSDPEHSTLGFKIKHLMISSVSGKFDQFEVRSETPAPCDFEDAQLKLTAQVDSLSTGNPNRDDYLIGPHYFDAEAFPKMEFRSTEIKRKPAYTYELLGTLTIKGITNWVHLEMQQSKIKENDSNREYITLSVNGHLNRRDWELSPNLSLDSEGPLLGEKIKINGEIQLVKEMLKTPKHKRKKRQEEKKLAKEIVC